MCTDERIVGEGFGCCSEVFKPAPWRLELVQHDCMLHEMTLCKDSLRRGLLSKGSVHGAQLLYLCTLSIIALAA